MTVAPRCPRCLGDLRAPGLMSSDWICADHGRVHPYHVARLESLRQVAAQARVPLWAPVPLLPGWTLGGLASCAKILATGHPTALWRCDSADDRVAFVGEASGVWLWAVLWPPAAELVLLEHVELYDLRQEKDAAQVLPLGAASPRLP
jgi:hypothetical protein